MTEQPFKNEYSIHSIDSAPPRNLERYEILSGVKREELRGKTVLDLGSSQEQLFDKELKASGIECKVISLSPDYSLKEHYPVSKKEWHNSVAAIAQALPFKEETFDYILDVGGPGVHASKPGQIKIWMLEVIRVLKKQGKFVTVSSKLNMVTFMRINAEISKQGHEAYYEKMPDKEAQENIREIIIKNAV
jgi:ubiquinone/menaquinone biosynthesis C-methylase UbiE